MSRVLCHVSCVLCHMSHVCYQWGLPRLVFIQFNWLELHSFYSNRPLHVSVHHLFLFSIVLQTSTVVKESAAATAIQEDMPGNMGLQWWPQVKNVSDNSNWWLEVVGAIDVSIFILLKVPHHVSELQIGSSGLFSKDAKICGKLIVSKFVYRTYITPLRLLTVETVEPWICPYSPHLWFRLLAMPFKTGTDTLFIRIGSVPAKRAGYYILTRKGSGDKNYIY